MAYFTRNTHLDKPGYMRLSTPWGSPKNNNNLRDRNLLDQHQTSHFAFHVYYWFNTYESHGFTGPRHFRFQQDVYQREGKISSQTVKASFLAYTLACL